MSTTTKQDAQTVDLNEGGADSPHDQAEILSQEKTKPKTSSSRYVMASKRPRWSKPPSDKPKQRRFRADTIARREIKRYQTSTELLIPMASFQRLVRKTSVMSSGQYRMTKHACEALHHAAEDFLRQKLEVVGDIQRLSGDKTIGVKHWKMLEVALQKYNVPLHT